MPTPTPESAETTLRSLREHIRAGAAQFAADVELRRAFRQVEQTIARRLNEPQGAQRAIQRQQRAKK